MVDWTVNLSGFYFYRLIGKLTAFLQLQEFSQPESCKKKRSVIRSSLSGPQLQLQLDPIPLPFFFNGLL
jgi:hypothetical protein